MMYPDVVPGKMLRMGFTVTSECLQGGAWSNTKSLVEQVTRYDNYYWNRPDEKDMRCGCSTIGPVKYNPNNEEGAQFSCLDRDESYFNNPDWFVLTSSDQCQLFCNKGLYSSANNVARHKFHLLADKAASFICKDGKWTGEPERGFWCYQEPAVDEAEISVFWRVKRTSAHVCSKVLCDIFVSLFLLQIHNYMINTYNNGMLSKDFPNFDISCFRV